MDGTNTCESSPGPNVVERPPNLKTVEDSTIISESKVSGRIKNTKTPRSSDAKNGEISRKRKKAYHTPTSNRKVKKASRKQKGVSVVASPSAVESSTNLSTDEDSLGIQAEVSNKLKTTNNPANSDGKNVKNLAENGKLSNKRKKQDRSLTSGTDVEKASKKRNEASVTLSPSAVECSTNHNTDEDSLNIQAEEISNKMKTAKNPANSDRKNAKKPTQEGKFLSKRKKPDHPLKTGTKVKKPLKRSRTPAADSQSVVECPSPLIIDKNTEGTQAYEVSNKMKRTNNVERSNENNTKKLSKKRKHPLTINKPDLLPMLQMVEAMKALRKQDEVSIEPGTSVIECSTNRKTEEDPRRIQANEVSKKKKTTKNPASSNEKSTKTSAVNRNLSLKGKKLDQPTSSQTMVVNANEDFENRNAYSVLSEQSVVKSAPNLRSDENSMGIPAGKVSNNIKKTNKPASSDKKNSNLPSKSGKLSQKRKIPDNPPTSQMVMDAIKALRKRNGASVDAILEYMEGQYRVNAKLFKRYVTRYTKSAVEKGIIEQLGGVGGDGRFKIKKSEIVAKDGKKQNK